MLMPARTVKSQRKNPLKLTLRRWMAPLGLVFGFCALLSAGVFGYHYLSQPGRLPLRVVEVSGALKRLEHDEMQRAVVQAIDGGFFSCDMQKLRLAVMAMPWVADASIRRIWPDRLSMVVIEQVPLARWGDDALVSVNAGVFRPSVLDEFNGLVKLSGPEGSQQRVVQFFQTVASAARARELDITEVKLDERRHWWLHFDGGLTVSLGREDIDRRLSQFFRIYPSLTANSPRQPERIDMRYEHGFAVRWREPAEGESAAETVKSQEKV
jgi:cell division protein FtsQ